jgi:hypothetical protein
MVDFSKNTALTLFVLYLLPQKSEAWIINYIKTGKSMQAGTVSKQ